MSNSTTTQTLRLLQRGPMDAADGSLLLVDHDTDETVLVIGKGSKPKETAGYRIPKTT